MRDNEAEKTTATENKSITDPMVFMSEEEAATENVKAEKFFKALRFGATNLFRKLKEVYEVEGLNGLYRIEKSLDAYMTIRGIVVDEVIASNPNNDDENTSENNTDK